VGSGRPRNAASSKALSNQDDSNFSIISGLPHHFCIDSNKILRFTIDHQTSIVVCYSNVFKCFNQTLRTSQNAKHSLVPFGLDLGSLNDKIKWANWTSL
jgi:hypothetical protein